MSNTGFATLSVIPSLRGMDSSLRSQVAGFGAQAGETASKSMSQSMQRGFSKRAGALGGALTKTLTPAAGVVALAGARMFSEFDGGFDTIRAGTGATGVELEKLGESFKRVGAGVTQPLSEVGGVIADLSTRTGQAGKPLEELSTSFLRLSKLTGEDARGNVRDVTRLFGDWNVASEDQVGTLDRLFRASQATGQTVGALAGQAVQFGAPLRQMGFGLDQTVTLLGKFEKEGVNSELVMGSLRIALGKLAREQTGSGTATKALAAAQKNYQAALKEHGAGSKQAIEAQKQLAVAQERVKTVTQDTPKAFLALVDEIKNAGSTAEANARAIELFGARAGPDMAAAVREGRFEIEDLFAQVTSGKDTIAAATADTTDLGDKFAMLKNRVTSIIGPFGEGIAVVGGFAASIGPALLGISQIGPAAKVIGPGLKSAALGFKSLLLAAGPIVLIGAAVVGLGALIFKFRDQIGGALLAVGRFFVRVFGGIIGFLKQWGPFILPLILGPIGVIGLVFIKFRKQAGDIFRAIGRFFVTLFVTPIRFAWNNVLKPVFGAIRGVWNGISSAWRSAIGGITGFFSSAWTRLQGIMLTVVVTILRGIKLLVDGAGKVTNVLKKIPGISALVPDLAAAGAALGRIITQIDTIRSGSNVTGPALKAARLHGGGQVLGRRGDEFLAVIEGGETVLTRSQTANLERMLAVQAERRASPPPPASAQPHAPAGAAAIGQLRGRLRLEGADAYIDARVESLFEAERKHRSRVRSMG